VYECARRGERVSEVEYQVDKMNETKSTNLPEESSSKPEEFKESINEAQPSNRGNCAVRWLCA